jgi:excisionase family DNA binding protein
MIIEDCLTIQDAAREKGYSVPWFHLHIRKGNLTATRVGGWTYVIKRSDLEKFMENHRLGRLK